MIDPNKIVPRYQIIIGLLLGLSWLVTGGLLMGSERAMILTQRFAPDAAHNVAVSLKGKIFYVNKEEQNTYDLYRNLFLGMSGSVFVIGLMKFMWEGYKETREVEQNLGGMKKSRSQVGSQDGS